MIFRIPIKKIFLAGLFQIAGAALTAQVTLEECVGMARENYPLIKKYNLLQQTEEIELSDINKGWLPQIGVYGQGTFQNAVPGFPDALSGILDHMGAQVKGLGKFQYKAGVEINQTIWDGGESKSRREVSRATDDQRKASLDVELYSVRERVENLFFSILLIEEQIKQSEQMQTLLQSNLSRMKVMKENGTAMQCDVDMMEAQCLTVAQQIVMAKGNSQAYRRMLGVFTGTDMECELLEKPSGAIPADMNVNRPELSLLDSRRQANEALEGTVRASLMPRIGFFAQGYYGYPGLDYFKSMMNREMSLNLLAGIKMSWSIGSLYTRDNRLRELRLSADEISVDRDIFLFNTEMQTRSQLTRIRTLEDLIKEDSRIVELRGNVRKAAEAQLDNGVIDATDLLSKITDENQARLTAIYHEIQLTQTIYQLKYTLNR